MPVHVKKKGNLLFRVVGLISWVRLQPRHTIMKNLDDGMNLLKLAINGNAKSQKRVRNEVEPEK